MHHLMRMCCELTIDTFHKLSNRKNNYAKNHRQRNMDKHEKAIHAANIALKCFQSALVPSDAFPHIHCYDTYSLFAKTRPQAASLFPVPAL